MTVQSSANSTKVGANRMVQLLGQWSDSSGPLYQQLADRVADLVESGSLRAGEQLPPERTLAQSLSVSRGTVVRAYEQLANADVVSRVQGRGTTIAGMTMSAGSRSVDFVGERLWATERTAIDLLKAIPSMLPAVADLVSNIDMAPHAEDLEGSEPLGWWSLRESIAALHSRQGLPTTPHQILVTSGAQQAISVVAAAMVHPGDVVLGEEDTWPGLIDVVRHLGARFEPVRLDNEGIIVGDLEAKIDRFRPALLAFNPQHQNPTGSRLPVDRVDAIAALTRRHRIPTLEDRVSADLGFDRRYLPAFDQFDTGGYGLIAGSVCKVAWPGLRLGWLRADAQVINRLRSHKAVADMFTPALSQLLGLAVLDRYDDILEQRLVQLRKAADLVVDTLHSRFPEWEFVPPRGGLSVWVTLPGQASASAFAQHAGRHGVLIGAGTEFSAGAADCPNIRIPFTESLEVLAEGLDRLAEAWQTFDRQQVGASAAMP